MFSLLVPKTFRFLTFVEEIKQKIGPLGEDKTLFFFIAKANICKQGKNL